MTNATSTLTLYAVTCPQDPHEERPAHYLAASERDAQLAYLSDYWSGWTDDDGRVRSKFPGDWEDAFRVREVDLSALAVEAEVHGDYPMVRMCRRAMRGQTNALEAVCRALNK